MNLHIFISHATIDGDLFKINELEKSLEAHPEIEEVVYWEEDAVDDIQTFMNENVGRCDILILLCSKNATSSPPVQDEWRAANQRQKQIIPIFIDDSDIPPILSSRRGIRYEADNYKNSIEKLIKLIERKIKSGKFSKKQKPQSSKDASPTNFTNYRGIPLLKTQFDRIKRIELEIGKEVQFFAEEGHITDLNLTFKEIRTILESKEHINKKAVKDQLLALNLRNLTKKQNPNARAIEKQIAMATRNASKPDFKEYEVVPKEKIIREIFHRYIYLVPEQDPEYLRIFWNIPPAAEFGSVIEFDIDNINMDIYGNYNINNFYYNLFILKSSLPPESKWNSINFSKDMLILKRKNLDSLDDVSSIPMIYHGGTIKSGGLFQWSYVDTSNLQPELVGQFWIDDETSAKNFATFNKGDLYKLSNFDIDYLINQRIIEIFKFYNPWSDNLYDRKMGKIFYDIEEYNLEYVILPKKVGAYETYLEADFLEREKIASFVNALNE